MVRLVECQVMSDGARKVTDRFKDVELKTRERVKDDGKDGRHHGDHE